VLTGHTDELRVASEKAVRVKCAKKGKEQVTKVTKNYISTYNDGQFAGTLSNRAGLGQSSART
jgi:hypothetical protein